MALTQAVAPKGTIEATFQANDAVTKLPLKVRMIDGSRTLTRSPIGLSLQAAIPHGLVGWVAVADATSDRANGSNRWLLEVSEDGSNLVWERLPQGIGFGTQVRQLTSTSDGSVYLMVADARGVNVYRRR